MDLMLDHYKSMIDKMENEKQESMNNLKNVARDHERFDYLVTCIQEFNDRKQMKCTGRKNKKIKKLKGKGLKLNNEKINPKLRKAMKICGLVCLIWVCLRRNF